MDFYTRLTQYYDYIFPLNWEQFKFVQDTVLENSRLLDVGCATGSLALQLTQANHQVWGIDINQEMIKAARQKGGFSERFKVLDLLKINTSFQAAFFDGIICVGNTLVHLNNTAEILDFFKKSAQLLKHQGTFLLQIVNYDRILRLKPSHLPTIENQHIRFERIYQYQSKQKIVFKTNLLIKATAENLQSEVELVAITKDQLQQLLKQAGYQNLQFWGDFQKNPLKEDSFALVITAKK